MNFFITMASGWASTDGVDDLFGALVVNEYYDRIYTQILLSNLVVLPKGQQSDHGYLFDVYSRNPSLSQFTLRLHTTDDVKGRVETSHLTSEVRV